VKSDCEQAARHFGSIRCRFLPKSNAEHAWTSWHLYCKIRGMRGLTVLLPLFIVALPDEAAAAGITGLWPALRLEGDYGVLSQKSNYVGTFSNSDQALHFAQYHRSNAGAYGLRTTLGLGIGLTKVAVFPRLEVAYVLPNRDSIVIPGSIGNYAAEVENHFWAFNLGAEMQFLRRAVLLDAGVGLGRGYSSFKLPAFESSFHDTGSRHGLLLHLGLGLRAPVSFPVTLGTRAVVESTFGLTNVFDRLITQPTYRLLLSVFVEFDPFYARGEP
jgi:hypothetical protein